MTVAKRGIIEPDDVGETPRQGMISEERLLDALSMDGAIIASSQFSRPDPPLPVSGLRHSPIAESLLQCTCEKTGAVRI